MVDLSKFVVVLWGVVGLIMLVVGWVPFPGRNTRKRVLVRLAGALLMLPWPATVALALVARVAREMDGNPPDKPETVQLIVAFVQLVLMFWMVVPALALISWATTAGKASRRKEHPDGSASGRSHRDDSSADDVAE